MKTKYNKRRYKLQAGVQYAVSDSPEDKPDYSEAYEKKGKAAARNQGITDAGAQIAGQYGSIAQVGGLAGDVLQSNIADKKAGSIAGSAVKMGSTGAAIGTMIMPGIGTAVGAGLGALAGGFMGASDYESQKKAAKKAEEQARLANLSKNIKAGSATDAQSFIAKKGKYKVKTKEPRLIETEGREPIFSPKKADGTRDLLYYNPNDPTHEEGGVKAIVMPMADNGKKNTKAQAKQEDIIDTDSWAENAAEVWDPTGILSWDDAYRALKNLRNNPKKIGKYNTAAVEVLGALPVIGELGHYIKATKRANKASKFTKAADFVGDVSNITSMLFGDPLTDEGFNYQKGTYGGRNIFPQFSKTVRNLPKQDRGKLTWEEKNYTKAYGAKQLKVNDLNNAALSQNFAGMPAANAPNKFIQPTSGKLQVARQIPDERRQEKIRTPRSHKTAPKDSNRVIDPPMLYEMKPKPEKSHSKKVKVYR